MPFTGVASLALGSEAVMLKKPTPAVMNLRGGLAGLDPTQVATNATDKSTKADTIANTENDIKILKQSIEEKKAEIDPNKRAGLMSQEEIEKIVVFRNQWRAVFAKWLLPQNAGINGNVGSGGFVLPTGT